MFTSRGKNCFLSRRKILFWTVAAELVAEPVDVTINSFFLSFFPRRIRSFEWGMILSPKYRNSLCPCCTMSGLSYKLLGPWLDWENSVCWCQLFNSDNFLAHFPCIVLSVHRTFRPLEISGIHKQFRVSSFSLFLALRHLDSFLSQVWEVFSPSLGTCCFQSESQFWSIWVN